MSTVTECTVAALEPFVGRMAADTCVRATALSLGKTADGLDVSDLPVIAQSIRRLLAPVASFATIEGIIEGVVRTCEQSSQST